LQGRSRSLTCAHKIASAACFLVVLRFGMARRGAEISYGDSANGAWEAGRLDDWRCT
jgi:hypothetical protein